MLGDSILIRLFFFFFNLNIGGPREMVQWLRFLTEDLSFPSLHDGQFQPSAIPDLEGWDASGLSYAHGYTHISRIFK